LLSVSLAFNGVATAVAATHVHAMASQSASLDTDACCAEHTDAMTSADHATHTPAAPADTDSSHDGCNGTHCACACPHAPQAALNDPLLTPPTFAHTLQVHGMNLAHPAPALLHLIRPPIV
jgi:hypothetical protein